MKLGSGTYLANPNIFGKGDWKNILSIVQCKYSIKYSYVSTVKSIVSFQQLNVLNLKLALPKILRLPQTILEEEV